MKQLKILTGITITFAILFTACKKDISTDTSVAPQVVKADRLAVVSPSTKISPALRDKLAKMPAGYEKRLANNPVLSLKIQSEYHEMALKAMNVVESTPCDGNTLLYQWLDKQIADWDGETLFWAAISGMLSFPSYDALFFENSSANQFFGVNQEYTHRVTKTFGDLQRFWNIQSNSIVLDAVHGNMLHDRNKLIRMDMILFGDSQEAAEYWADLIIMLVKEVPQYRNGNHPIFTFNAYAQSTFDFPPYGKIPDKIVIGDGIMEAFSAIGYADVAPQAIAAHEFGHHIQYQLHLLDGQISPEATRKSELMADAYAAYFLSHSRGASMQWKRVKQFLQVFFNIGDCAFSDDSHHGTPTQRIAAAEWGYQVAENARKQGHILPAQKFTALFNAQLPMILKQ